MVGTSFSKEDVGEDLETVAWPEVGGVHRVREGREAWRLPTEGQLVGSVFSECGSCRGVWQGDAGSLRRDGMGEAGRTGPALEESGRCQRSLTWSAAERDVLGSDWRASAVHRNCRCLFLISSQKEASAGRECYQVNETLTRCIRAVRGVTCSLGA